MGNNIITLSETKDYKYIGIPVPRYAKNIRIGAGISIANERAVWYGSESNGGMIHVPLSSELMGILGETLTEEQAMDILEYAEMNGKWSVKYDAIETLISLIESEGVKVKYIFICESEVESELCCKEQCSHCLEFYKSIQEEHNSEVKKVVIIKIKK